MAQPREQDRPAAAKRARNRKLSVLRSDTGGGFVVMRAGDVVAKAPITKVRLDQLVGKTRPVGRVVSGYADAAAKAKRTGRTLFITYKVTPDGSAEAVSETPAEAPAGVLGGAIARAKARGAVKATEILKGGDMLTAHAFGELIGASHETVNTKRKRHELLGLQGATRAVRYPRWQVTDNGLPLPGLARLFGVLGEQPWTVYRFLRTEHAELGGKTALEALKAGQVEAVVGVAENQSAGAFS